MICPVCQNEMLYRDVDLFYAVEQCQFCGETTRYMSRVDRPQLAIKDNKLVVVVVNYK